MNMFLSLVQLLADYVVDRCIQNPSLRDELFVQLVNQTVKNPHEANVERAWLLFAHAGSSFGPSASLKPYLLKYASDRAWNGYKNLCQRKLLKSGTDQSINRHFPPTLLEWKANR